MASAPNDSINYFRNSSNLWVGLLISDFHSYFILSFLFSILCFCVLGNLSSLCRLLTDLVPCSVHLQALASYFRV